MPEPEYRPIGGWSPEDLAATARAHAGPGSDDGVDAPTRFKAGVSKLLRRRLANPTMSADPPLPSTFVLQPNPPEQASPSKREPMLDSGTKTLTGRYWFVGPAVVSGRCIEREYVDDDELFRFVTDDLGLGDRPAVIHDPRTSVSVARYYPGGLSRLDDYQEVSLAGSIVTLDAVTAAVERTHAGSLVTPDANPRGPKLWLNQSRRWPSDNAEGIIQFAVKSGLLNAFPLCDVREEEPNIEGRLDLRIVEPDPLERNKVTSHAILELKVLRSFWSTGKPVPATFTAQHIKDGIEQASAYRHDAPHAALCCFDMRLANSGEECFDAVRDYANELAVALRRWFLYASARSYRVALAAAKAG